MLSALMIGRPESARIFRPSSSFVPFMRTTSGTDSFVSCAAATMPFGDRVAAHDAAEDVDEDALDLRVAQHDLERLGDLLRRRAAADVEEVRRLAAEQLDRVHRRHREPGAVDEAADVAVERDVREIELRRLDLRRVLLVEVAHLDDVRMAEQRVAVEVELRVERDHLAVAGEDQRIDLGERRVGLVEHLVQALEQLARLRDAGLRNADPARDFVRLLRR